MIRRPPRSTLFPYTNALPISRDDLRRVDAGVDDVVVLLDLREVDRVAEARGLEQVAGVGPQHRQLGQLLPVALEVAVDRKSTRLNSSHANISYAVFCLKKKKK